MLKKLRKRILAARYRKLKVEAHELNSKVIDCRLAGNFYLEDYWCRRHAEVQRKLKNVLSRIKKLEA